MPGRFNLHGVGCATEIGKQRPAFSTRWQDPTVFTADKLSADEELISLLDLKTALLWCCER
jgi:hypothetical protein